MVLVVFAGIVMVVLLAALSFGWLSRRLALVLVSVLTLLVVLLALGRCGQFLEVDRCLDSGGRWNEETQSCEH